MLIAFGVLKEGLILMNVSLMMWSLFVSIKKVNSCPCNTFGSCNDCVQRSRGDCVWCTDKRDCVATNATNGCLAAHNCPCDSNKECLTCQEDDGCAWCTADAKCIVKAQGANCTGPLAHTCPKTICQDHLECDGCKSKMGCKWCSKQGACKPANDEYEDCITPLSCSYYCALFDNCDTCNAKGGCGWCAGSKSCVNLGESTCLIAHTCPIHTKKEKKAGFDGGSFVGGMFLVIGLVGLGVVGYLIYRWKFSQRANYTELTVNKS